MGRTNIELNMLKKTFNQLYGKDLVKVLSSELSGDLKKAALAAMQANRADYDATVHTAAKAAADADALYKAGEARRGTDTETFVRILFTSPPEHLQGINLAYMARYKKSSLINAVKKEFSGDAKDALLFFLRWELERFEQLAELFEKTMKGFGTDEYALSSAVVRYHALLPRIKTAYKRLYGKELRERIRGDTSGTYRKLLLKIVDGA